MTITDILWDWNGTLLDDTQAALDALNIMLARRGAKPIAMDYYRDNFGFPVRPFYEHIGMDIAHEDWDALAKEYHVVYTAQAKRLNPDAIAALEFVKAKGVRQSIVSALRQDLLDNDLATFGVRDYFAFAFGTDNLDGSSKLSRARELLAVLQGGEKVNSSVVIIGDAFHDKEVADALGIGCVLHSQGSHAGWRLRQRARVADSLSEAVQMALAATGNRQPTTGNQQPATGNLQPPTGNRQPATNNRQPATGNLQPATSNRQPATNNRQPTTCSPTLVTQMGNMIYSNCTHVHNEGRGRNEYEETGTGICLGVRNRAFRRCGGQLVQRWH